jgi:hypothetical protein
MAGRKMAGRKDDAGKLELCKILALPDDILRSLVCMSDVIEYGAQLYGRENWRELDNLTERYCGASARHIRERLLGEPGQLDPQSGLPVLAHALCGILFVMANDIDGDKK